MEIYYHCSYFEVLILAYGKSKTGINHLRNLSGAPEILFDTLERRKGTNHFSLCKEVKHINRYLEVVSISRIWKKNGRLASERNWNGDRNEKERLAETRLL